MIDRRLFIHMNWSLLALTLILFGAGLLNLYSASIVRLGDGFSVSTHYQRQILWGGLGLLGMLASTTFDYRHLQNLAMPAYIAALLLLLAVDVFGVVVMGARRWIPFGFFNWQPSEAAKLAVLLMTAKSLAENGGLLGWKRLGAVMLIGLVPTMLIIRQPDLGTGLIILALVGGMILYHGIESGVLKPCLLGMPALLPLIWLGMHDYQKMRVLSFLDPGMDPEGAGYHIIQSQIAIGSGALWGKGFLEGSQHQLRFLPEKHTDFVLAVFGEERGFIGCVILLTLFCLFMLRIIDTVRDAKDRFGSTLVAGIFFYFFWQMLVNMGMVIGLMPVVGIPLPFFSYGGSAMVVNFALVGIVLNVSMRRFIFKSRSGHGGQT
jgi:rod shape determining protein RodA